jgi:hypothetical protein
MAVHYQQNLLSNHLQVWWKRYRNRARHRKWMQANDCVYPTKFRIMLTRHNSFPWAPGENNQLGPWPQQGKLKDLSTRNLIKFHKQWKYRATHTEPASCLDASPAQKYSNLKPSHCFPPLISTIYLGKELPVALHHEQGRTQYSRREHGCKHAHSTPDTIAKISKLPR